MQEQETGLPIRSHRETIHRKFPVWPKPIEKPKSIPLVRYRKSIVQEAVEKGHFWRLTQKQQEILIKRGYLQEGPLVSFRQLDEVKDKKFTLQAAFDREARAFSRLGIR